MGIAGRTIRLSLITIAVLLLVGAANAEPLASWNEGAAKSTILDFVAKVTKDGGADYVAPAERIAVFDNDGTLWAEQPIYFQFAFALDRVKALAPNIRNGVRRSLSRRYWKAT